MRKKILLIEDETPIAETIKQALELQGYDVIAKDNSYDGLKEARKKPDLIILDDILPRKNGFEIAVELKENKELSAIPCILLSDEEAWREFAASEKLKLQAYFDKPFAVSELLTEIKGIFKIA